MAKIVQFEDGTYGVRTYWLPFHGWHFTTTDTRYSFFLPDSVNNHCKVSTLDQAQRLLNLYKGGPRHTKRHRVITPPPAS